MRQSTKLDLSEHSLNNSSSKQRFSFSKSERFKSPQKLMQYFDQKIRCDSFYQIPTTKARRTTSFGYGCKNLGIRYNKDIAPVGTYELPSEFKLNHKRGFGFGKGRQEMQITGPLRQSMTKQFVPGPGSYPIPSSISKPIITLKSRIPDHSIEYLSKIPGPGTYQSQQLGSSRYYVTSNHPNLTNRKFSQSRRSASFVTKSTHLAPGDYDISVTDINPKGRYILSKQQSSKVRQFPKQPRKELVYKHMLTTPGPGTYEPFSDFGAIV